jgi:hypothetical protein
MPLLRETYYLGEQKDPVLFGRMSDSRIPTAKGSGDVMNLNWTTIKIYLTPPLTPPFRNGGVKSFDELIDLSPVVSPEVSDDTTDKPFDELTDGATNGSVKSFDQLIDNLWFLLRMMLDGVGKKNGDYWQQYHHQYRHRTVLVRNTHPSNSS